ncbi:hypothetical protein LXA43DRAFT_22674 [Ganoderma leucocontextum]|nr:hypothetical protein LXA43DRAFT_22674 [Ganoderma leucocontextum]
MTREQARLCLARSPSDIYTMALVPAPQTMYLHPAERRRRHLAADHEEASRKSSTDSIYMLSTVCRHTRLRQDPQLAHMGAGGSSRTMGTRCSIEVGRTSFSSVGFGTAGSRTAPEVPWSLFMLLRWVAPYDYELTQYVAGDTVLFRPTGHEALTRTEKPPDSAVDGAKPHADSSNCIQSQFSRVSHRRNRRYDLPPTLAWPWVRVCLRGT